MFTILIAAAAFALGFAGGREYPSVLAAAKADALKVDTAIKAALHIGNASNANLGATGTGAPVPPVVAAAAASVPSPKA